MSGHGSAVFGLAFALLLTACGGGEQFEASRDPILGGTPAPDDTAVVGVVNFAGGQCSGSLISPSLVLTARHCVAKTADKDVQVVCGKTTFEPPDSPGAIFVVPLAQITEDPQDYRAVTEIRMPDGLGDDLCGTDVVLLRLKKPLELVPISPRLDVLATRKERYSAVGFGIDESLPDHPSGVRKRLDGQTVTCTGSACNESGVFDNEWVGSGGPCSGDSGGPALDADGRIIGVVSRGTSGCQQPVFSDVMSRADWLRAEARRAADLAHAAPPDWACEAASCDVSAPAQAAGPTATCTFSRPALPAPVACLWGMCGSVALLRRARRSCKILRVRPTARL